VNRTVRDALKLGNQMLAEAGIPDPPRETKLLMAVAMNVAADCILLDVEINLSPKAEGVFFNGVQRRKGREPLSHILGYRDFYGRKFIVTRDVLDPRPDTETLVAAALAESFSAVLDLGTGSGAILLTLLAERPDATGVGADVEDDGYDGGALGVAKRNAKALEVCTRCTLMFSDWFEDVTGTYDLIVSNPPYIAADEMDDLQPEVRDHEPRMALTDEADGLTHYRHIIAHHDLYLRPGGQCDSRS